MIPVRFYYADIKPIRINGKRSIREFIIKIFQLERKPLKEVIYVFCSDDYLLDINASFLHHDFHTDIISFDLSEGLHTIGEIYISVQRVKENALEYSSTFGDELSRVIFHGALHLCGYKDKRKSEIRIMRQKEEYYLQLYKENYC